jgi:hypothetical protein
MCCLLLEDVGIYTVFDGTIFRKDGIFIPSGYTAIIGGPTLNSIINPSVCFLDIEDIEKDQYLYNLKDNFEKITGGLIVETPAGKVTILKYSKMEEEFILYTCKLPTYKDDEENILYSDSYVKFLEEKANK